MKARSLGDTLPAAGCSTHNADGGAAYLPSSPTKRPARINVMHLVAAVVITGGVVRAARR